MGEVRSLFRLYGPAGQRDFEGVADTGATFTKVPLSVAVQLGIDARFSVEVELADGRVVARSAGLAEVEIDGVRRPVLVSFSEADEKPLIGVTTLETLGYKVNPVTRRLERVRPIEY